MDKISFEKLDDSFVNLYEIWIFTKAFEYSACVLNELFWYKLIPSINKKTWYIYIESWFPRAQKDDILYSLNDYNIRYFDKYGNSTLIQWEKNSFSKDTDKLYNIKKDLVSLY